MPKMSKMPKLPKINVFYPLYQQHHFLNSKIKKPETRNSQHVTRTSQAISCQSEIRILKSQIERPAPRNSPPEFGPSGLFNPKSAFSNPKSKDPHPVSYPFNLFNPKSEIPNRETRNTTIYPARCQMSRNENRP
jgi:hypothetical protein